jgi:hypothetical protein
MGSRGETSNIWKQLSTQIDKPALFDRQITVVLVSNAKCFGMTEVLHWQYLSGRNYLCKETGIEFWPS